MRFSHLKRLITICLVTLVLVVKCGAKRFYDDFDIQQNFHTSIVVFGASWADNGHSRPQKYAGSLRPPPNYHGRYSNGIIWAEYLANGLIPGKQIPLFDYAYGGATLSNKLTYTDRPDTKTQVNTYISDIKNGTLNRGIGPVLHVWWVGINSMSQIWTDAIKVDSSMSRTDVLENARSRVDQQINELERQLNQVRSEPALNNTSSNFLILPIPPLETVLTFRSQATNLAKNNFTLARSYLQLIGDLSHRYNEGILRLEDRTRGSNTTGWVKTFDFECFWRRLITNPGEYGLQVVDKPCLQDVKGKPVVCSNPDKYLYWDTLHPTTAAHKIMAEQFLPIITA